MRIAEETTLQGIAVRGRAVQAQQAAQNAATGALGPKNRALFAGGPGSGRKPGPGQGKQPGSGRPFGVSQGIHKVLSDAGYVHKGGKTGYDGRGAVQYNAYQHPVTGDHVMVQNGEKWSTHGPGNSPLLPASGNVAQKYGDHATTLQTTLQEKHHPEQRQPDQGRQQFPARQPGMLDKRLGRQPGGMKPGSEQVEES